MPADDDRDDDDRDVPDDDDRDDDDRDVPDDDDDDRHADDDRDVPDDDEDDRRDAERRASERRRFRSDPGRRLDLPRRRADGARRRGTVLALLLGTLAVAWIGARLLSTGPARSARTEAAAVARLAAPRLGSVALPLQPLPGFAPPLPGDPAVAPALAVAVADALRPLAARARVAAAAAPSEPAPWAALGPVLLALGEERDARHAFHEALALAPGPLEPAALALAALTLRAAARASGQDRAFTAESAALLLLEVDAAGPHAVHRTALLGLAGTLLADARRDEALAALDASSDPLATAAAAALRSYAPLGPLPAAPQAPPPSLDPPPTAQ